MGNSTGWRAERGPDSLTQACFSVVALIVSLALAAVIVGFWFCFDDLLATITGAEWVGNIGFWQMFSAVVFVRAVTGRSVNRFIEK